MQTTTSYPASSNTIKWPLIWSLIALNAAIIISWIAYHNYQPVLLERFGYAELSELLEYSKLLVMATVPPLAGYLADRLRSGHRKKLPLLTAGVGITALIFMTVAATISPQALLPLRSFLPVMIVLWLISMNVFYAPALATMEEFVPAAKFSIVMGVFVLISDLIYSLEPAIVLLVDFLGAPLTFVTGGVLIGVFGFMFQRLYWKSGAENDEDTRSTVSNTSHIVILMLGLLLGFVVAYLINVLPMIFEQKMSELLTNFPVELIISAALALTAFAAFIMSKRIKNNSAIRPFLIAFALALIGLVLCSVLPDIVSLVGLLIVIPALAYLSVLAFPLAIQKASLNDKMFAAGLFVAGMEIPDSFLEIVV
jgi:MFS family permease